MNYQTVISRKTPKTRRPIERRVFFIKSSLRKNPIELKKYRKFTLGRSSRNSLRINEGTVSARHASIRWDKSSFKITDERSTNGTFVNGRRVSGTAILKSGDKIKLGKFVLTFASQTVREKPVAANKKGKKSRRAKKSRLSAPRIGKAGRRGQPRRRPARGRTARRSGSRTRVARRKAAPKPFRRDLAVTRIRF
jgi:pSer/pThr/pTyr-binding forkhead associated (FHA) protein